MDKKDMNILLNMLSKMDKKDLENGLAQANKILNTNNKNSLLNEIQKNLEKK